MRLVDKIKLYAFFIANVDNPRELARYYYENRGQIEELKKLYPDWRRYAHQYPELLKELQSFGVTL